MALDSVTGKMTNMAVTAYTEKRGRPIAMKSFLSQFFGKTSKDKIEVNKDINSISGATISAKCAAFQAKKVITMYDEVFLNKPLIERLKDSDVSVRNKALAELGKMDKTGKDKLLQQLVDELSKKETNDCQKEMIVFALDAYSHQDAVNKLLETKLPAGVELNGDLESALNKLAESAKVKITWSNDVLKASAKQVKVTAAIKTTADNNFYAVLTCLISQYGCLKCRAQKDDKLPNYLHQLNGDSIEITDLDTAQKRSLDWWNSNNNKNTEDKKGASR
jgi:Na+-translocating ferredoxin:NAD+ oxidoreductase RnfG subunit